MADPLQLLEERLAAAFATVAGRPVDPVVRASDRADAQANGALALAKELGRPPRELAQAVGGVTTILPLARDTEDSLRTAFAAAADHDVIVTIGGASVGDHDLVGRVAAAMGIERAFHRIAMRPGKPLMAGRLGSSAMLGLPGNPVSAMVCAILFLQPLLRAMQGDPNPAPRLRHARLGCPLPPEGDRQH